MRYYLQDPNGNETEVTALVLRALESIVEMAFDLETAVVPSDFNMDLDNSGGQFDSAQGLFAAGERTRFLVIVRSDDGENILFIGTVKDTIYTETSKVEIESKSVIAALLGCSFNMSSVTTWDPMVENTPARLVADLLGPNGLQLPGIFLDNVFFDLADESEQNLGLKMRLEIPDGESIPFTDFLQELNRVTGAYVYSYNGYIRYARQGGFDRAGFDYTFDGTVIAGTVKNSRPVLWQKTRVEAMYWDGSAAQKIVKTMADFFDVEGESIMDEFREKTIESDGLGGKLIHATLASAEVGLQDVLSWRGRPRWDFEFEVDAIGHDVRGMAQAVPLLSRVRLLWSGGCAQLAVVEKTTNDQKTTIKGKSLAAPTFIHPAKRLLPVVTQNFDEVSFNNNTPFDMVLYYKIEGETAFTRVLLPQEDIHTITLPDFESVTWKVAWGLPCGELMGDENEFETEEIPMATGQFDFADDNNFEISGTSGSVTPNVVVAECRWQKLGSLVVVDIYGELSAASVLDFNIKVANLVALGLPAPHASVNDAISFYCNETLGSLRVAKIDQTYILAGFPSDVTLSEFRLKAVYRAAS